MESTDRYRRYLKRRNFSPHTVKAYMNILAQFTDWLTVSLSDVTRHDLGRYVDHLMGRRLSPKTITCHLQTIRLFFDYLITEEDVDMANPITKVSIRLPKPLPRHLKDDQVGKLLAVITDLRDRAMFTLMLRCGLRVEEVSRLTVDAVEFSRNRLFVANGKGRKDRVVYLSKDARFINRSISEKAIIEDEPHVPRPEGAAHREADIGPGHPEEDRILCPAEQHQGLMPQPSSHHGHPAS